MAEDLFKDINSLNKTLVEKVQLIEQLDDNEKKSIFSIVDGLVSKKKMKESLTKALSVEGKSCAMIWNPADEDDSRIKGTSPWLKLENYKKLEPKTGVYIFADDHQDVKYIGKSWRVAGWSLRAMKTPVKNYLKL